MNYYEHHLGDYIRDAGHLSLIEEGAYRRLIDVYYIRERALPGDVLECQKLARCKTSAEKKAVTSVLKSFFQLCELGFRHKRCDEVIAEFHAKQQKARNSANARWSSVRSNSDGNANASGDPMRTHSDGNARAMLPISSTQYPVPNPETAARNSTAAEARAPDDKKGRERKALTPEAAMAVPLRQAGVKVTSMHPTLVAWVQDGFTLQQVLGALAIARERKGEGEISAAYLDPIVRSPPKSWGNGGVHSDAPIVTHEQREAADLQRLKDRRASLGLTDFRDPKPGETASQYRRAQDDEIDTRRAAASIARMNAAQGAA